MNIYDINTSLVALMAKIPDTGELSEELLAELESLELAKADKQKNIILYVKNVTASADAIDNEIKHLQDMKKRQEAKKESLMKLLEYSMGQDQEIDFKTCGAKFKKNPPSVLIEDESLVPDVYKKEKTVTVVDKIAIKSALQAEPGLSISGAKLVQNQRLDIF